MSARGLEAGDPAALALAEQAAWHARLDTPREAREAAQAVMAQAEQGGQTAIAARAALTLILLAMRASEAAPDTLQALEQHRSVLAAADDQVGVLRAQMLRALWLADHADHAAAIDLLATTKQDALLHCSAGDLMVHLNLLAHFLYASGQMSAALAVWYEALERALALGEPAEASMPKVNLGVVNMRHGDFGAAEILLSAALTRIKLGGGLQSFRLSCSCNLACVLMLLHRPAEALALLEPLQGEADIAFEPYERQFFAISLAQAYLRIGRVGEAAAKLADVHAVLRKAPDEVPHSSLGLLETEMLLAQHRTDEARARFALLPPGGSDDPAYEYERLGLLASLLEQGGDAHGAWRAARERRMQLLQARRQLEQAEHLSRQVRYEVFSAELEHQLQRQSRQLAEHSLAEIAQRHGELASQVARLEALQAQLKSEALRDSLSGLYNRHVLDEFLPRDLLAALRDFRPFSLALLEIDALNGFTHRHGRAANDALLRRYGALLRELTPLSGAAVRYADAEFCLLLPGLSAARAEQLLSKLLKRVGQEVLEWEGGSDALPSFSAGIAQARVGDTGDLLLTRADLLRYRAGIRGQAQIVAADGAGTPS